MSQPAGAISARRTLLGIAVNQRPLAVLVARALQSVDEREQGPFTFACANPHSLVAASRDPDFRQCLRSCTAVVADGVGVKVAGMLTGRQFGPRITGWDFFHATMSELDRRGGKAYFFGSRAEVLERIRRRAAGDYPGVRIETHAPPYGEWSREDNEAMVARIRGFAPDALWVGMTAPRQEKWVQANAKLVQAPLIGSIGAVFDYYAGTIKRAPSWICKLGLEWLYRLAGEPVRLWRRTLISAPQFLCLVLLERVRPGTDTDDDTIAPAQ